MDTYPPTQLILDGSLEQRVELAQLAGELRDERIRVQTALDVVQGKLRELMQGHPDPKKRVSRVDSENYSVLLKRNYDVVCAKHRGPIRACHAAHDGDPIILTVIELAPYFYIKRVGDSDDATI